MHKQPDWQIVVICDGYVIEVDCNSGARRRVFQDGQVQTLSQSIGE